MRLSRDIYTGNYLDITEVVIYLLIGLKFTEYLATTMPLRIFPYTEESHVPIFFEEP